MIEIKKYPDGTSYAKSSEFADPNITFKINSYTNLWELNQIIDVFYSRYGYKPAITIPNLIDAQADRRFSKYESSGLKLVCNFLNNTGAKFKIFHPHNPEVVEALIDNVEIIDNSEFIKQVLYNEIAPGPGFPDIDKLNNLILMSSDAGGFKPLMKLCDKIRWTGETHSAVKSRKYNQNTEKGEIIQEIYCDDFKGKDILIIDDISVYGGTFKGLAKMLRERNCGKLYLAVSHMTVQNLGKDPVTEYFDKVFTTNSKFEEYTIEATGHDRGFGLVPENLNVIKLF